MALSIEYLWRDRRRRLGLPLSFTRYALSDDRLFLSVGLLSQKEDEILLYRVRDVSVTITLWQRIFGVGSVKVVSSDRTCPELVLKNIRKPREVKELIHQQVEEMKIRRRMRVSEVSISDMDNDYDNDFDGDGHPDF